MTLFIKMVYQVYTANSLQFKTANINMYGNTNGVISNNAAQLGPALGKLPDTVTGGHRPSQITD